MTLRMLQIPGLFQALEYFPWALFVGMAAGLAFAARYHQSRPRERYDPETRTFLIEPLYMPLMLLIVIPLSLALSSGAWEDTYLWRQLARIILAAGLYFTGLAALAPLLRRAVSARARAALWVLPNLLYVLIYIDIFRSGTVILQIPRPWLLPVLVVWSAGAIALLGWHILSHLRFRKTLLASAVPELNDPMQQLWHRSCAAHKVRTDIPLTRSASVETPLSVGCFQKTMVLVLPEKGYTADELELIFRHELRHIKRADMRTKIWMALWKSLLWFFPPVWWAAKITAEDLELCCDEEVLTGAEPETRRRYAELLLDSAAPASGFSTCLSADAAALGRRLKQAISPRKVWRGDWIVGIFAGLLMLLGPQLMVSVTDNLDSVVPDGLVLDSVRSHITELPADQAARDALDRLLQCSYIQLDVPRDTEGRPMVFQCSKPGSDLTVNISVFGHMVWVYRSDRYSSQSYYIWEVPDLTALLQQFDT